MMETKELTDVYKAAPLASSATGKQVLLTDSDGNPSKVNSTAFCRIYNAGIPVGGCMKISNVQNVLISMNTNLGGASALVYISTYDPGTIARAAWKYIRNYNSFKFYINGSSVGIASIYVKNELSLQTASIRIIPLDGMVPTIESVASIPADATLLSAT